MSYSANQPGEQVSIYDQVGGEETFDKLTRRFYALVKADPEFSAMYPDFDPFPPEHLTEEQTAEIEANDTDHFDASARRLKMFLIQYFGGPSTYQEQRGHPRLRIRHNPYPIGAEGTRYLAEIYAAGMITLDLP